MTVKIEELLRTSRSWDGAALPDYPQGRPEIVAVKYEIPAGQKLGLAPSTTARTPKGN